MFALDLVFDILLKEFFNGSSTLVLLVKSYIKYSVFILHFCKGFHSTQK